MTINYSFLTSKVARRIFVLFVVCALVPITALAIVSFGQVSRQLYAHGEDRLKAAVRAVGQGVAERLLLLEAELRFATDERRPAADPTPAKPDPMATGHFASLAFVAGSTTTAFHGDAPPLPELTTEDRDHLAAGRTLLITEARGGMPPLILLLQAAVPADPDAGLRVGSVSPRYLWGGGEDTLPRNNQLCVFDHRNEVLFCTRPADGNLPAAVRTKISTSGAGTLEWDLEGDEFLAAYWSMPLAFQFGVPQWTVMLSESRADLLAPMDSFRRIFPLVILLSMWVVLLLSIGQIRRSLIPLERLREGTREIGAGQFDSRVDVSSNDEFEELAGSFNDMAGRLGKQFKALATISDIDRTILSSLNIEKIVGTVLERTSELIPCHALSITLDSPDQQKVQRTYVLRTGVGNERWVETTYFSEADFRRFEAEREILRVRHDDGVPPFLAPLARAGSESFVVFPMFIGEEPAGAIAIGFRGEAARDGDDLRQARQLTDQVAVALANAHLLEDLDSLNWGALTALARAVDAKSPWTAGHSERVAEMGLKLGVILQLDDDELDVLRRGGLLHDIGKIGVPAAILDKPGKLTEEEFALMKKHPEIGANILQPIATYADVIPIVLQHHERWDGTGYPGGLAGRRIHRYARIFAVADVFDALVSDRPYRPGMSLDEAVRIIIDSDGSHFDSEVVAAFLQLMAEDGHVVPTVGERPAASGYPGQATAGA